MDWIGHKDGLLVDCEQLAQHCRLDSELGDGRRGALTRIINQSWDFHHQFEATIVKGKEKCLDWCSTSLNPGPESLIIRLRCAVQLTHIAKVCHILNGPASREGL